MNSGGVVPVGELIEGDDHWVLPIADLLVTQLRFDFAVTLIFEEHFHVRMEGVIALSSDVGSSDSVIEVEGDVDQLVPLLRLKTATVREGLAFKDGRLELTFTDGSRLVAPAGQAYESWQLAGPHGLLIVSVPDGGLTIWMPKTDEGTE
ncbi:hypothetical protein CLV85_2080 [Salinibacterium amurskyense]|uniref:Uncharacterized protein n=1 Tax=Salinibacterium amurskyense TaxID=205941 RepID=A0A2M9D381_9MICO|nr:DUF6188 family protein [Salinibacterium amurskyense]PJJ78505.1 hypothetical protein CLV85_2080 [Salinibacterium amurskyense]RLQ80599.1 hypothetical protein D9C83_10320 [Salinibacterium amurskyense]GHD83119.1 hypothetical protein GCM10007394_21680 [Salinibacterium amurskyense]